MNRFARLSFLVATALLSVGCTKCYWPEDTVRDITYTIAPATFVIDNATTTTVHLATEAEWQALLDRFCDWAEEGSAVTFCNANRSAKSHAAKEATTYSTTDREAMKRWMAAMEDEGKTVTVTYDPATGTWNGTAYATVPQPSMPSGGILTYESRQPGISRYIIFTLDTVQHRIYCTFNSGSGTQGRVYPQGLYSYGPSADVNTTGAYWLVNEATGDTAGLYLWRPQADGSLRICDAGNTNIYEDFQPGNGWYTYLCTDMGLNLVMHLSPSIAAVYPPLYCGQSSTRPDVNCIIPFEAGRFELLRTNASQPSGMPYYPLRLDYSPYGGGIVDSLTIQGEPCVDNAFTIGGATGCLANYTFQRVN